MILLSQCSSPLAVRYMIWASTNVFYHQANITERVRLPTHCINEQDSRIMLKITLTWSWFANCQDTCGMRGEWVRLSIKQPHDFVHSLKWIDKRSNEGDVTWKTRYRLIPSKSHNNNKTTREDMTGWQCLFVWSEVGDLLSGKQRDSKPLTPQTHGSVKAKA